MKRALILAVVLALAIAAPVAARHRLHALLPGASCSVANVARGDFYTVTASGLDPASVNVQAWAEDSHGLQVFGLDLAPDGTATGGSYASWDGTYNVTIYDYTYVGQDGTRSDPIATCTFEVSA